MRFDEGALETERSGRRWTIEPIYDGAGREMLYLLSFYLPRFLNNPFQEKLVTVFHELWHIAPAFDGDLRRHPGRCYAHGRDGRDYDRRMDALARRWLALSPPEETFDFLRYNFVQLKSRFGRVYGMRIANPRLVPI
jgi:predicted metallopeptidase